MEQEGFGETPCGDVPPKVLLKEKNELKLTTNKLCTKCKERNSTLLFRRDLTCWDCFNTLFGKKFRQCVAIGRKSRTESEHVLLALSGGFASRAMLHAMHEAIQQREAKHTFFDVSVLHIDEGGLFGLSEEERKSKNETLEKITKEYSYPFKSVPLETVLSLAKLPSLEDNNSTREVDEQKRSTQELIQLFQKVKGGTSKEDLLEHLRNALIAHTAHSMGIETVMDGSTGSRLAIRLMSSTAMGRGFSLPEEIAALDSRFQKVKIMRPMRDFLSKEVAVYCRFKKLECVFTPSFDTKSDPKYSIQHLSEAFIEELQKDFPHTVHTLLRSGSKLTTPSASLKANIRCALCSCVMQGLPEKSKKKQESCDCNSGAKECCGDDDDEGSCASRKKVEVRVEDFVCSSCRYIVAECEDASALPPFVKANSSHLQNSVALRAQIQDFLLDDE